MSHGLDEPHPSSFLLPGILLIPCVYTVDTAGVSMAVVSKTAAVTEGANTEAPTTTG